MAIKMTELGELVAEYRDACRAKKTAEAMVMDAEGRRLLAITAIGREFGYDMQETASFLNIVENTRGKN
jgi:hypothetical protein